MAQGLPISDIVNVQVVLAPKGATFRDFGSFQILGPSNVVDMAEGRRSYPSIEAVTADFGTTTPEALAAALYFAQSPQPSQLYIARWAQAATAGLLRGGVLSASQQLLSNFTAITAGGLVISVDGSAKTLSGVNLSGASNLNGVASLVQTALVTAGATGATVQWDSVIGRFTVSSGTTGASSTVSVGTGSLATAMGLVSGVASAPVVGVIPETLPAAVARIADKFPDWYGLQATTATPPSDADYIAAAAIIEASNTHRIFGITTQATTAIDPTNTSDLPSQLKALGYKQTFVLYSTSSPYAAASMFGRAFTVDFSGNNTTITLKFKQLPGVVAETLTETQAQTLKSKNVNVLVNYNNNVAILQEGVMCNGFFFDEVHGLDWLQNNAQTRIFNLLFQSGKVPQTDDGMNQVVNQVVAACFDGATNGLIAPGQWNADGFGSLRRGDTLKLGYYVYCRPVAQQAQTDREQRKTPLIQAAVKLAGAVHFANVLITANR